MRHSKNPANKQHWATPPVMVAVIAKMLDLPGGAFDLDVCATPKSAKARRYYTPVENGLVQPWNGSCWCNPPFAISQIRMWAAKAVQELIVGHCQVTTFMSSPKSDQDWWHYLMGSGWCIAQIDVIGRVAFIDEFDQPGDQQSMPTTVLVLGSTGHCWAPQRAWVKEDESTGNWSGGWYGSSKIEHATKYKSLF